MSTRLTSPPGSEDLPAYYREYVERVAAAGPVLPALGAQAREVERLLAGRTEAEETFRYAPGKWSVREVLGHLMDTERVFQLRALWFAREDPQPLPGFDENDWGAATGAGSRPLDRLLEEYGVVRRSTVLMFENMIDAELDRTGEANGRRFRVGAIPWFLLGHERHHLEILRERYEL
jgi:hypothetical protein